MYILIFKKKAYGGDKINEIICEVCSKRISLNDHPLGLVFENSIFVCEDCSTKHTKEEITKLSKSMMLSSQNVMPIALWLIQQQNKEKTMMI